MAAHTARGRLNYTLPKNDAVYAKRFVGLRMDRDGKSRDGKRKKVKLPGCGSRLVIQPSARKRKGLGIRMALCCFQVTDRKAGTRGSCSQSGW